MTIEIRRAEKNDCNRMMELIQELALFEKAPEEVTVQFDHFVESGFGSNPVWWAFVAEINGKVEGFAGKKNLPGWFGRCLTGMNRPLHSIKNTTEFSSIMAGSTAV